MKKEDTPRVWFRLTEDKHKQLKRIAIDNDTSLQVLLNTAVESWLYDYENAIYRQPVDLQAEMQARTNNAQLIDTIMSDLQSTGLDAFNGNDRYDISEQVRQVLERRLGGYQ